MQHGVGADGSYHLRRTIDAVAALRADVVALQEVDVFALRSRFAHQARRLAVATAMAHAFCPAARVMLVGKLGNALLVRGTITDASCERLPMIGRSTPRSALFSSVEVDGMRFSVAVTHLSIRRQEALTQLGAVCALLAVQRVEPWLLMGDLNLRPADVDGVLATAGLVRAAGSPTRPSPAPAFEIDHIAARGFELSRTTVVTSDASDHLPIHVSATVDG
ncbi:MAG TPA: endonuclease/exonuclease/phosphatase family protein [Acidimicrobiales bacterium]